MGKGLGLKLFVGASMVGADFAFLLCILRLLTDAHLQQVDVTDRNAPVRYAYQLSGQVHYDLLGMIVASFTLVYVTQRLKALPSGQGSGSEAMPSERMVELSGRTVARIYKLRAADDFIRKQSRQPSDSQEQMGISVTSVE